MRKKIDGNILINYWLSKYHNTNVVEVAQKYPEEIKTGKWFHLYSVTQEQHDEWEKWAKEYAKNELKISNKMLNHDWPWIYLDTSPTVKIQ